MFLRRRRKRTLDEAELFAEIEALSAANRAERSADIERELRRYRHLAGISLVDGPSGDPADPEPAPQVPELGPQSRVPEVTSGELTAEILRASVLAHGCLLVRGLVERERATELAAEIERAFEVRTALRSGPVDHDGYYEELQPEVPSPNLLEERRWVEEGGGMFAIDSPRLMFGMLDSFEGAGLRTVIEGYLGERAAISSQKCTLRKTTPDVTGAWHQDGAFLGDVRALNVWLSLSRCGDVAPSMDIVPRRLDEYVPTGTEGTWLDFQVSQAVAEEAAAGVGIVRPIFEPGDALLFDEVFLHQTGSDPSMPNSRYAIESWFFGPSAYPDDYVPVAF